jgi:drug/metabolite transporter (DMT)-like permease
MSTLPDVHPHTRRRAIAMLCLACLLWGGSFPIVKAMGDVHQRLDPEVSALVLNASIIWPRFAIAAVLVLPWAFRQLRGVTAREWSQALGLSAFLSGGLLLQVDGLRFTAASTSSFLTQGYVVILPLWVYGRARRWPPLTFFAAMALVVPGVAILAGVRWDGIGLGRGEIETLLAACFFAGQILWLERPAYRDNRGMAVTVLMFVCMAAVFVGVAVLGAWGDGAPLARVVRPLGSGPWLALTGLLAVFCTAGAFSLMNLWQRWVRSTEAGLIYTLEPVFTAVLALFLPAWFSVLAGIAYENEQVTWRMVVGGVLVCAANVVIQRSAPPSLSASEHA